MTKAYPELADALSEMLDKIDAVLRDGGYRGEPVKMYLAGGMAVNYWCGSRHTEDVDASFSKRVLLPYNELVINYTRSDGTKTFIYFDSNYNTSFALLHEDYEDDSLEWEGIGNEHRLVHLYVLNPIDLAVSKIARFTDRDREDIRMLASCGLINAAEVKARAEEALSYYVGYVPSVQTSIDLTVADVALQEKLLAISIQPMRSES
jgi:hypothetical protein